MIRINAKESTIKERILQNKPTWLDRASQRTEDFRAAGSYNERSSIWSEIKEIYMDLQNNKCAYCERLLEDPKHGKLEHDIEHYRPKNAVKEWPPNAHFAEYNYDFPTGLEFPEGYYLLAYNILNYVTACKPCNTNLKSNYFPIGGSQRQQNDNPRNLRPEKPFLIYPLSNIDQDPETLIDFIGIIAKPVGKWGHKHRRGQVTIDFFNLNGRETLRRQRAERINEMWLALVVLERVPDSADVAQETITRLTSPSSSHCNCLRSFLRLYQEDPSEATRIFNGVRQYLQSLQN